MLTNSKNMDSKLIPLVFLSLLISSCCWLRTPDCVEEGESPFTIGVEYSYNDSVIQVDDTLDFSIKTSDFLSIYTEKEFQNFHVYLDIIWFNGDFSSPANFKVKLISSSESQFSLSDYRGYNGVLPDDIDLQLAFTIPGYYLILLNGGAFKDYQDSNRRKHRCKCTGYAYQNFLFESDQTNAQYFPRYENSIEGTSILEQVENQGAYFIKVE